MPLRGRYHGRREIFARAAAALLLASALLSSLAESAAAADTSAPPPIVTRDDDDDTTGLVAVITGAVIALIPVAIGATILVVNRTGHVVYTGGALDERALAAFRAALGG